MGRHDIIIQPRAFLSVYKALKCLVDTAKRLSLNVSFEDFSLLVRLHKSISLKGFFDFKTVKQSQVFTMKG